MVGTLAGALSGASRSFSGRLAARCVPLWRVVAGNLGLRGLRQCRHSALAAGFVLIALLSSTRCVPPLGTLTARSPRSLPTAMLNAKGWERCGNRGGGRRLAPTAGPAPRALPTALVGKRTGGSLCVRGMLSGRGHPGHIFASTLGRSLAFLPWGASARNLPWHANVVRGDSSWGTCGDRCRNAAGFRRGGAGDPGRSLAEHE